MRKYMTKEVTSTIIMAGYILVENGQPIVERIADEVVLGNLSKEKAQKHMEKHFQNGITVYEVETITETYQMKVEDFIKHAEVVPTENE